MYNFIELQSLCLESKILKYCIYFLPLLILFVCKKLVTKQLPAVKSRKETGFHKEDNDEDKILSPGLDSDDEHCGLETDLVFDPLPFLPEIDHIPYSGLNEYLDETGDHFYNMTKNRRSVRHFDTEKPVDFSVIEKCVLAAGTAPSGVGTQPWTYCVIRDPEVKQQVRDIIEAEEYLNYTQRMSLQWLTDLRPLQTNHLKPYLTDAPYVIVVFKQIYGFRPDGTRLQHYYNEMSVSVSVGMLVSALTCAGLNTVVTKPANIGTALKKLLKRPDNERFAFVIPVGHAVADCKVAVIDVKPLKDIMVTY